MPVVLPQPNANAAYGLTTELLLVRHGHSAPVVLGSDDADDPPLSPRGVDQAAALAARLRAKPLAAVYASELKRADQTAAVIAVEHGLPVCTLPDLREVDLGSWSRGEFHRRAAARDAEWSAFIGAGRWDVVPRSEGDAALRARARSVIESLVAAHAGTSVLAVTHSGFINACLAELWGTSRTFLVGLENTSITVVRAGDDDRVVVAHNDHHHLHDILSWRPPTVSSGQ